MIKNLLKYILIICSLFVLSSVNFTYAYNNSNHPVRIICSRYREMPYEVFMTPYEACLYALDDIDNPDHVHDVRLFLEWYLSRVNRSDKHGMSGTVYDFILYGDIEKVLPQYDSIDGYSGVILFLLNKYYEITDDVILIDLYWQQIEDIAYTIPFLQQKDGLTIALPDYRVKYLMDNSEAYGGIMSFLNLAQKTDKKINTAYYKSIADSIKRGIWEELYNSENDSFRWSDEKEGGSVNWSNFYPDAYAQIFPIYYDILDDDRKYEVWKEFIANHPAESWNKEPVEQAVFCGLVRKKMGRYVK